MVLPRPATAKGNAAEGLCPPCRRLPWAGKHRAMYFALSIATVIYVAIALGVFGTLTVESAPPPWSW